MKTTETVRDLGLYASLCCFDESVFDNGDTFSRCPKCQRLCRWQFVEKVIWWQELDELAELPIAA
jgi:hypothetical protein